MAKSGSNQGYRYGQLKEIQNRILESRGMDKMVADPTKSRQHIKLRRIRSSVLDVLKTPTMRLIEIRFNKPIEDMLLSGPESAVAARLDIDKSTVSKWIKKLMLRTIICTLCTQARVSCTEGWCWRFRRVMTYNEATKPE